MFISLLKFIPSKFEFLPGTLRIATNLIIVNAIDNPIHKIPNQTAESRFHININDTTIELKQFTH